MVNVEALCSVNPVPAASCTAVIPLPANCVLIDWMSPATVAPASLVWLNVKLYEPCWLVTATVSWVVNAAAVGAA